MTRQNLPLTGIFAVAAGPRLVQSSSFLRIKSVI
jgi:hypothetical protein